MQFSHCLRRQVALFDEIAWILDRMEQAETKELPRHTAGKFFLSLYLSLSSPRVGLMIDVFELLFHQLGINLRGADIRVAQHLLYGVEVRAVFK